MNFKLWQMTFASKFKFAQTNQIIKYSFVNQIWKFP